MKYERFQLSNNCWISDKLFDVQDDKARDHSHITGVVILNFFCNISLFKRL